MLTAPIKIYQFSDIIELLIHLIVFYRRYVGGEINACHNAVDRHVKAGYGKKVALIHDSPLTSTIRKVTYDELLEKTSRLAGALANMGVQKGDRVLIYMPLVPETVIAILASARLGAVHSVVFGGNFSSIKSIN